MGIYASLVNINAYNQPGVEAGKKAAKTFLDLQYSVLAILKATDKPTSLVELAENANASAQIEHIYKIVRHLAENERGIVLQGDLNKPASLTILIA